MKIFFIFLGSAYGLKWSNNQYDGYEQRAYSNYEGILRKIAPKRLCNIFSAETCTLSIDFCNILKRPVRISIKLR